MIRGKAIHIWMLGALLLLAPGTPVWAGNNDAKSDTIRVSSVGYAACRGLITYGGKTFALWLAGSNPATATIFLVGLAGSQVAGRGFDAVAAYLKSEGIEPPTVEEIIDDFEIIDIEEENEDMILEIGKDAYGNMALFDPEGNIVDVDALGSDEEDDEAIPEIGLDSNGELSALDLNGNVIEVGIVEEKEFHLFQEVDQPSYIEQVQQFARYTFRGFVGGLPRMGVTTIPSAVAGAIVHWLGGNMFGEIIAAAVNPAVSNLSGQIYDRDIIVLQEEPEELFDPENDFGFTILDPGENQEALPNNNNNEVVPVISDQNPSMGPESIFEDFELLTLDDTVSAGLPKTYYSF